MYLEKRKLKQAPQLTVAAVRALEIICTSNTIFCAQLFREHCYSAFLPQPDGQIFKTGTHLG